MSRNYNFTHSDAEGSEDFFSNLPSLNINSIPSSQVVSPISPEEMLIRSRGRRQFPPTFSPERNSSTTPNYTRHSPSPNRSSSPSRPPRPGKKTRSSSRLSATTETLRRHLQYEEENQDQEFSILKLLPVIKKGHGEEGTVQPHPSELEFLASHKVKKQKMVVPSNSEGSGSENARNQPPPPLQLVKALSKAQLVDLLTSLTATNPTLSSQMEKLLPKPDLTGLISNLVYLNQNIYKAIPVTRLSDRTDSMAYNRVCTHLSAFKKSLVEDLTMLMESEQGHSVLEYVIKSWEIVVATPVWDNPVHNTIRNSCFKHLAISVLRVIKQQDFYPDKDTKNRLLELMIQSSIREVLLCREKLVEK